MTLTVRITSERCQWIPKPMIVLFSIASWHSEATKAQSGCLRISAKGDNLELHLPPLLVTLSTWNWEREPLTGLASWVSPFRSFEILFKGTRAIVTSQARF